MLTSQEIENSLESARKKRKISSENQENSQKHTMEIDLSRPTETSNPSNLETIENDENQAILVRDNSSNTRFYRLAPLKSLLSHLQREKDLKTGKQREKFWYSNGAKVGNAKDPNIVILGKFKYGSELQYQLEDDNVSIPVAVVIQHDLWSSIDVAKLIEKDVYITKWTWVPPSSGSKGHLEVIGMPGIITPNHFLDLFPNFEFSSIDFDPEKDVQPCPAVIPKQLLDLQHFNPNQATDSLVKLLQESSQWKHHISVVGAVQAKSVLHSGKSNRFFFVQLRMTDPVPDDDGFLVYMSCIVHVSCPEVEALYDSISVGSQTRFNDLSSALVMEKSFKLLAWVKHSSWTALPSPNGPCVHYACPATVSNLITYTGKVTSWCGPGARMLIVDDLYPVFYLHVNLGSLRTNSLRVGSEIVIHNVHVVPLKQYDIVNGGLANIYTLVACSFTTIEVLKPAETLEEDYDPKSVLHLPDPLKRFFWFRDSRNWDYYSGTSVPIPLLSTPELIATFRLLQQLKEKLPGVFLPRDRLFGSAAKEKMETSEVSIIGKLLSTFGFQPLARNVWMEFLNHSSSCRIASNRFQIPELLHLQRIYEHKMVKAFFADPVDKGKLGLNASSLDTYACVEFTQEQLGLENVALCGILTVGAHGGLQLVDMGLQYLEYKSACAAAEKEGEPKPEPSFDLFGKINVVVTSFIAPHHLSHPYIIKDFTLVAQKFGTGLKKVTKIHAKFSMESSICIFRNPEWPYLLNPLTKLDIFKVPPRTLHLSSKMFAKSMLALITVMSPMVAGSKDEARFSIQGFCLNMDPGVGKNCKRFHMEFSCLLGMEVGYETYGHVIYATLVPGQVIFLQNVHYFQPIKPYGEAADGFLDIALELGTDARIVPFDYCQVKSFGFESTATPFTSSTTPTHDVLGQELEFVSVEKLKRDHAGEVEMLQSFAEHAYGRCLDILSVRQLIDHPDANGVKLTPFHGYFERLVNFEGVIQSVTIGRPSGQTYYNKPQESVKDYGLSLEGRLLSLLVRDTTTADSVQVYLDLGSLETVALAWIDDIVPGRIVRFYRCARKPNGLNRNVFNCVNIGPVTKVLVLHTIPKDFSPDSFMGLTPANVIQLDRFLLPALEWQRKRSLVRLHVHVLQVMEVRVFSHCTNCSFQIRSKTCPNKCEPKYYQLQANASMLVTDGTAEAVCFVDHLDGVVALLRLESGLADRLADACEMLGSLTFKNSEENILEATAEVEKPEEVSENQEPKTKAQEKKERREKLLATNFEKLLLQVCIDSSIHRDIVLIAKRILSRVDPQLEDPTGFRRPVLKSGKLSFATLQHPKIQLRVAGLQDLSPADECRRLLSLLNI